MARINVADFFRKNGSAPETKVKVQGHTCKLQGQPQDESDEAIARLALAQSETTKVSNPKSNPVQDREQQTSRLFAPEALAILLAQDDEILKVIAAKDGNGKGKKGNGK